MLTKKIIKDIIKMIERKAIPKVFWYIKERKQSIIEFYSTENKELTVGTSKALAESWEHCTLEVLRRHGFNIKDYRRSGYDFLFENIPLELKTSQGRKAGGCCFTGNKISDKKGDLLGINYELDLQRPLTTYTENKGIIKSCCAVYIKDVPKEWWYSSSNANFSNLKIPISEFEEIKKSVIIGSVRKGKKYCILVSSNI